MPPPPALTSINYEAAHPSVVELDVSKMSSRARIDPTATTLPTSNGKAEPRQGWREWGEILHRNRLGGMAAWLLEAGRPLAILSAQLLYAGSPFLGGGASKLAHLLESEEDASDFVQSLESKL